MLKERLAEKRLEFTVDVVSARGKAADPTSPVLADPQKLARAVDLAGIAGHQGEQAGLRAASEPGRRPG